LKKLSDKILLPLHKYIEKKEKLIISRSSHLNLLPMQIFPYREGLLFEKIAISYALSSALVFFEHQNIQSATLISNSTEYDSPKAKELFVQELNYVEEILESQYSVEKFLEDNDSRNRLFEQKQDIIHIINHGTFSTKNPNSSGIFLKERGRDIFVNIDNLFGHEIETEFIFMSGCSTGEVYTIKGEEPLGIISYLHSNGVKSAILSSWKIPSQLEVTVCVVRDFYRYWIEEKLDKSVALQRAMVDNKRINPYEYGGFVLFGEG
jgi:CHAT domain-containing protein